MLENPIVSVTILAKNGGERFVECLEAVFSQEIQYPYEVVVVDSGSTDGTQDVYQRFPVRLFKIKPEEFCFGPTRDLAIEMARGQYVAILSQDAVPINAQWLSNLVRPFDEDEMVGAVQGVECLREDLPAFYWQRKGLFYYTRDSQRWLHHYNGIGFSNVNSAVRRNVWQQVRFGSTPMSEDKAFQQRLVARGIKIAIAKDAVVSHSHSYTMVSLFKRCVNEGLGWRAIGWRYRLWECGLDLVNPYVLRRLKWGIQKGEICSAAEVLFPFIRPLAVYIGNHFVRRYVQ